MSAAHRPGTPAARQAGRPRGARVGPTDALPALAGAAPCRALPTVLHSAPAHSSTPERRRPGTRRDGPPSRRLPRHPDAPRTMDKMEEVCGSSTGYSPSRGGWQQLLLRARVAS